ncbi:MAG: sirohydrochlorin chelatase [Nitrososphaeraceae archaeon]
MNRALLLIDRGSREPEAKEELSQLCTLIKQESEYVYVGHCFLEVIPPYIEEGINTCISNNVDSITVMPYFLYPGMKLKDSVKKTAKICYDKKIKVVIAKPLSYHSTLNSLIRDRISFTREKNKIVPADNKCDILVIGHGSSDKSARTAFVHTVNKLKPYFRSVTFCFLELDEPRIASGIEKIISSNPNAMIIVPYFLHKGAHIKNDVVKDIKFALTKYNLKNIPVYITEHFGVDPKLVNVVLERAKEAEEKVG